MEQFLSISKALSDETRVRALMSLREGELCLCHIIELLGLSPSTISKHMEILQRAGLVYRRKEGRWVYFRLADAKVDAEARRAIDWVLKSLESGRVAIGDQKKLRSIRRKDLVQVCECYKAS